MNFICTYDILRFFIIISNFVDVVNKFSCEQFGSGSDIVQCILNISSPKPYYTLRIVHTADYNITVPYSPEISFQLGDVPFGVEVGIYCEDSRSTVTIHGKKSIKMTQSYLRFIFIDT